MNYLLALFIFLTARLGAHAGTHRAQVEELQHAIHESIEQHRVAAQEGGKQGSDYMEGWSGDPAGILRRSEINTLIDLIAKKGCDRFPHSEKSSETPEQFCVGLLIRSLRGMRRLDFSNQERLYNSMWKLIKSAGISNQNEEALRKLVRGAVFKELEQPSKSTVFARLSGDAKDRLDRLSTEIKSTNSPEKLKKLAADSVKLFGSPDEKLIDIEGQAEWQEFIKALGIDYVDRFNQFAAVVRSLNDGGFLSSEWFERNSTSNDERGKNPESDASAQKRPERKQSTRRGKKPSAGKKSKADKADKAAESNEDNAGSSDVQRQRSVGQQNNRTTDPLTIPDQSDSGPSVPPDSGFGMNDPSSAGDIGGGPSPIPGQRRSGNGLRSLADMLSQGGPLSGFGQPSGGQGGFPPLAELPKMTALSPSSFTPPPAPAESKLDTLSNQIEKLYQSQSNSNTMVDSYLQQRDELTRTRITTLGALVKMLQALPAPMGLQKTSRPPLPQITAVRRFGRQYPQSRKLPSALMSIPVRTR